MSEHRATEYKDEFIILGITHSGKKFRPSDWSERLSSAMSSFRPEHCRQGHLYYSPYVQPVSFNCISAVLVDRALVTLNR